MSGKFQIVSRHKTNQRFRPLFFFGFKDGELLWGNDQQKPPTFDRAEAMGMLDGIAAKHLKTRKLTVEMVSN